jgi:hypothetical protein
MDKTTMGAFHSEVHTFKQNIYDKYGIKAYVISDAKDKTLNLESIEECVMKIMENDHPEYIKYWRSKTSRTREPDFVTYCTIFTFFARNAGYTFDRIGQFINRKHCSVMHQYNTAKNRLIIGDHVFMDTYVKISKRITEYVGIIPKNTKV